MLSRGLVDVENPSVLFLGDRQENISGSVVVSSIEGDAPASFGTSGACVAIKFRLPA